MSETSILTHQESILGDASVEMAYEVVSDITLNELPHRIWETRSEVVVAGSREFAWVVGGRFVRWGLSLAPAGTTLTESWRSSTGAGGQGRS